jgi:splicing factor 1
MAELGEGGNVPSRPGERGPWGRNDGSPVGQIGGVDPSSNIPPWRRPEMWQTPTANQGYRPPYGGGGAAPYASASPWAQAGYQQYPPNGGGVDAAAYAQYYQSLGYGAQVSQ